MESSPAVTITSTPVSNEQVNGAAAVSEQSVMDPRKRDQEIGDNASQAQGATPAAATASESVSGGALESSVTAGNESLANGATAEVSSAEMNSQSAAERAAPPATTSSEALSTSEPVQTASSSATTTQDSATTPRPVTESETTVSAALPAGSVSDPAIKSEKDMSSVDAFIASAISQPPPLASVPQPNESNESGSPIKQESHSNPRRSASPDVNRAAGPSLRRDERSPGGPDRWQNQRDPRDRGGPGFGSPPRGGRGAPYQSGGGWEERRGRRSRSPQGEEWRPRGEKRRFSRERDGRNERDRIHERSEQERPGRVLFCRNIKYDTPLREVEHRFRQFGEVKSFFDLIQKRGMVFVTYYDLRSAELARTSLTGAQINRRPIDVHYSLPRDSDIQRGCDRDKNQGTLLITVSNPREPVLVDAIQRAFAPFGDIKHITPSDKNRNEAFIEYWDSRATNRAFDALNGEPLAGGRMQLSWTWDMSPPLIQQSQRALGNFYNAPAQTIEQRLEQAQKMQALLSNLAPGPGGPMRPPPMMQGPPMGMGGPGQFGPPMHGQGSGPQGGYMPGGPLPPQQQQRYGQPPMPFGQPPQNVPPPMQQTAGPGFYGGDQGFMGQYQQRQQEAPRPPNQQPFYGNGNAYGQGPPMPQGSFSPPPPQQQQQQQPMPGSLPPALMSMLQNQQNPSQQYGANAGFGGPPPVGQAPYGAPAQGGNQYGAPQQQQFGSSVPPPQPPTNAYSPQYGLGQQQQQQQQQQQRPPQPPGNFGPPHQQAGSSYRPGPPSGPGPMHQQQQPPSQQQQYGYNVGQQQPSAGPGAPQNAQTPSTPAEVQALLALLERVQKDVD